MVNRRLGTIGANQVGARLRPINPTLSGRAVFIKDTCDDVPWPDTPDITEKVREITRGRGLRGYVSTDRTIENTVGTYGWLSTVEQSLGLYNAEHDLS